MMAKINTHHQANIMVATGNYYFHTTIARVNLAAVMQALRAIDDVPKSEIEADIRDLLAVGIAQGKEQAVSLLLKYNLAYFNYAQNSVSSHDGSIQFAQIKWSIKSLNTSSDTREPPSRAPSE